MNTVTIFLSRVVRASNLGQAEFNSSVGAAGQALIVALFGLLPVDDLPNSLEVLIRSIKSPALG